MAVSKARSSASSTRRRRVHGFCIAATATNVIIEQIRDHHVPSIRESATQGPPLAAEHGRIIPFCDRA
jgi:ribosomal protein L32